MSRNSKNYVFNSAPAIQMSRSKISGLSYDSLTSFSEGDLVPIYSEEILPGDTFKVKTNAVIRLANSFLRPIYGNLKFDVWHFFVPWRLVYDDFPCVFGENKNGYWSSSKTYYIPGKSGMTVYPGSLSDYLELPLGINNSFVNVLYHRAYALIWNEWFRDENYQEPVHIYKGDFNTKEDLNNSEFSPANYTGKLAKVNKYRDYFTSALPDAQKGESVAISSASFVPLTVNPSDPGKVQDFGGHFLRFNEPAVDGDIKALSLAVGGYGSPYWDKGNLISTPAMPGYPAQNTDYRVSGSNLGVELARGISVNDLRLAFQTQKILERDSLGTRYIEHIYTTFGVSNPDARLQRPELLGASSIDIDVQQVANTSGTASEDLASLGAYSLSAGTTGFSKAFTEYGCVISLACIRQFHNYQQGTPRRFNRQRRLDYYNPALAYIGMMPIHSTEIYAQSSVGDIFGYQRPWSEYRHHQNCITGQMRSVPDNELTFDSLDMWHIGDMYGNAPVASAEFIEETPEFLDRAITVKSSVQNQFIANFFHRVSAVRVMPSNPMPGLIDHY